MQRLRFKLIVVALVLVALVVANLTPPARAQETLYFVTASASCGSGAFTVHVDGWEEFLERFSGYLGAGKAAAWQGGSSFTVQAVDSVATLLGTAVVPFDPFVTADYSGTIAFASEPAGATVTFNLYYAWPEDLLPARSEYGMAGPGSAQVLSLVDTITVPYTPCTVVPADAPPAIPAPGCEMVDLTGAVMGMVFADAAAYYQPDPDALVLPVILLHPGQTVWVFGLDFTHRYYKILLGCSTLWVPGTALGPNYFYPWYGAPLPSIVVK